MYEKIKICEVFGMIHCNDFLTDFIKRYNYPSEAENTFLRVLKRLDDEKEFADTFDKIVEEYLFPTASDIKAALEKVKETAEKYGENEYTMNFVFILSCLPTTFDRYKEKGISEDIFYDTFLDLKCKLIECIKCKEVPGTFVPGWYDGFLQLTRFAYGRFQFEETIYDFDFDFVTKSGHRLTYGDKMIGFHIPSSGVSLTDEVRLDSYKKAYEAYKHFFPDGVVYFKCGSWLLFPRHREFLPEKSNILKFMGDFELMCWSQKLGFHDDWRIFDKYAALPPEKLPTDTSLRKAYADWLKNGNMCGSACGVIAFDGEKILK